MTFKYMLAPLEDTSDNALRELCHKYGADLTFTEMTRLAGLVRDNKSTLRKIEILNNVPTQIQLSAQKENNLKIFLEKFKPADSFAGINFNLGCPSPHLVREGLGCALMKRVSKVNRLVGMVKDFGYPCSLKMRLGLNYFEQKKKTYVNLIEGVDADFFVVHARHGAQHYEFPADYSVFPECVDTGKSIIANGDIDSKEKVDSLKKMKVDGVMVGRAAVSNPAIFQELKGIKEKGTTDFNLLRDEYSVLAKKYFEANNFNTKYKDNVLKRLGKKDVFLGEKGVNG